MLPCLSSLRLPPKLLERLRDRLRGRHDSWKTERAYVGWIERDLRFHKGRNGGVWKHPTELGKAEIEPRDSAGCSEDFRVVRRNSFS